VFLVEAGNRSNVHLFLVTMNSRLAKKKKHWTFFFWDKFSCFLKTDDPCRLLLEVEKEDGTKETKCVGALTGRGEDHTTFLNLSEEEMGQLWSVDISSYNPDIEKKLAMLGENVCVQTRCFTAKNKKSGFYIPKLPSGVTYLSIRSGSSGVINNLCHFCFFLCLFF